MSKRPAWYWFRWLEENIGQIATVIVVALAGLILMLYGYRIGLML